jgi:hypothetical protein
MKRLLMIVVIYGCILVPAWGQKALFLELSGNYLLPWEMSATHTKIGYPFGSFFGEQIFHYSIKENYKPGMGMSFNVGQQFRLMKFILEPAPGISYMQFIRSVAMEPVNSATTGDGGTRLPGYLGSWDEFYDSDLEYPVSYQPIIGLPVYNAPKEKSTVIVYLNLPLRIYYPLFKERILIGAGISASIPIWSRQPVLKSYYPEQFYYNDNTSDGINNFFLDGNLSLGYQITPDIQITSTYHHGLSPVYDEYKRLAGDWKSKRISFGIKYIFNTL